MLNKVLPSLFDNDLAALQSPKMAPADRVGVHGWFKEYAGFSESFALSALELLGAKKDSVVFDPFLGSGTSLVASQKLGLPFIGVELSPFSALLSRTKASYGANKDTVLEILNIGSNKDNEPCEFLNNKFDREDVVYASGVINKIKNEENLDGQELLSELIGNSDSRWDDFRVAVTAILLSARETSRLKVGSNPAWFRRGCFGESRNGSSLEEASKAIAVSMLRDLHLLSDSITPAPIRTCCVDAKSTNLDSNCFDVLLTSPPYLNRLDYVVKQLPEILLLSLIEPQDLDELKKSMVGTNKIVEKGEPDASWGNKCFEVLDKIKNHPSKASGTYYIWNYYKYFKDIYKVFAELKRLARPSARGVLVVQNSHYKELLIPVSDIFIEMGESLDISICKIKKFSVRTHMGQLSPEQRSYAEKKTLEESILYFEF